MNFPINHATKKSGRKLSFQTRSHHRRSRNELVRRRLVDVRRRTRDRRRVAFVRSRTKPFPGPQKRHLSPIRATPTIALISPQKRAFGPVESGLTLPLLGDDIPRVLSGGERDDRVLLVIRALLDAGLLQSTDWTGELTSSLARGFARIVEESGANGLRFWKVEAFFSTVIETELEEKFGICTEEMLDDVLATGVRWPGMMGFSHDPYLPLPFAFVGSGIVELELDHQGAGFAVMGALCEALESFNGVTPRVAYAWALEWAQNRNDEWGDMEAEEYQTETGEIHPSVFKEQMPTGAISCRPSVRILKKAARTTYKPHIRDILEIALKLQDTLEAAQKSQQQNTGRIFSFSSSSVVPLVLSWNPQDCTTDVCDSYLNDLSQWSGEEVTEVVAHMSFDSHRAASIVSAVKSFSYALRALALSDQLLMRLQREDPINRIAPVKIVRPKPLHRVLCEEFELPVQEPIRIRL